MTSHTKLYVIALLTACFTVLLTFVPAHAQTTPPPATPVSPDDCAACHADYHASWFKGAHSEAQTEIVFQKEEKCTACHKEIPSGDTEQSGDSSPKFQDMWSQQGKPNNCLLCHVTGYDASTGKYKADGVTCQACHGPTQPDHPKKSMTVDKTSDLCRKCHTDARFSWATWKTSAHYQNNMTCISCHDPHSTTFKDIGQGSSNPNALCENCHKDQAKTAEHATHAKVGETCVDCHLGSPKGPDDYHQVPDHSFKATLETCNRCHADQMHNPGQALTADIMNAGPTPTGEPTVTAVPTVILDNTPQVQTTQTPLPVNVLGFVSAAGLIGLLGGVVLAMARKHTG